MSVRLHEWWKQTFSSTTWKAVRVTRGFLPQALGQNQYFIKAIAWKTSEYANIPQQSGWQQPIHRYISAPTLRQVVNSRNHLDQHSWPLTHSSALWCHWEFLWDLQWSLGFAAPSLPWLLNMHSLIFHSILMLICAWHRTTLKLLYSFCWPQEHRNNFCESSAKVQ